jgi:peptide/nickel transport system permease protein
VLGFVVARLFWALVLALVITLFTFIIFFVIPTDQRSGTFVNSGPVDPTLQGQFNLRDKSVPSQYVHFVTSVFEDGDLGRSIRSGRPVTAIIGSALPVTAALVIGGVVFWLLLAIPIGIISALRPRSLIDRSLMVFLLIGVSAHPIWLGLMLSYFLGYKLHVFPITGYCDVFRPDIICGGPRQWAYHMFLPWMTFAFLFAAIYARMIRASVLETLDEDYVRTARAKGAGTARVQRHVLRNAMLPVVSMLGMDIGIAFGGAVFIETVFGLPGLGKVLVRGLSGGDLPVIMGVVLVVSFAVAIANLIVDIVYCSLDPRVRIETYHRGSIVRLPGRRARSPRASFKESTT